MYEKYNDRLEFLKKMDNTINYNCDKLIKYVNNNKSFGQGMDSYVYKLKIKDDTIIIKHQINSKEQEEVVYNNMKKLIMNNICPHMTYLFDSMKCNNQLFLLQEIIEYPLEHWLKETHSKIEWFVFIFQIAYYAYIIEKHYNYYNTDIKINNITYFTIKKGGYIKYTINNKEYYVPNIGIIFVTIDYGNVRDYNNVDKMTKEKRKKIKQYYNNSLVLCKTINIFQSIKLDNLLYQYTMDQMLKMHPEAIKIQKDTHLQNEQLQKEGITFDDDRVKLLIRKRIILKYMIYRKDLKIKQVLKYPPHDTYKFLKTINIYKTKLVDIFNKFDMFKHKKEDIRLVIKDEL
jgi:hypothetical protein